MLLPLEILDIIVDKNNDNLNTLISWAKISPRYKRKIQENIGVITILDGLTYPQRYPLDYNVLFNDNNNVTISTEGFDSTALKTFTTNQSHILISIHSNNMYSQLLRFTLAKISHYCQINTVISIIYFNSHNYMSRLYFQEFERFLTALHFSELYVYGNWDICNDEGLFDLVNFFRNSYLNGIQVINSLTILDSAVSITSSSLQNIQTLGIRTLETDICNILKLCPRIKSIGSLKFPVGDTEHGKYILPKTEKISLTDCYPQLQKVLVDGNLVQDKLDLSVGVSITDPIFSDLYFPNIRVLQLHLGNFPYQTVQFKNCNFSKLTSLNCDTGIVPWEDLLQTGANITKLSMKLYSTDQISWLNSCPYDIKNIEILSTKTNNIPNISFNDLNLFLNDYTNISLTLQTLLHCNIFQNVILPSQSEIEKLNLKLDDINIVEEMKNNLNYSQYYHLNYSFPNYLQFEIPYIKELLICATENQNLSQLPRILNDTYTLEEPTYPENFHYYNNMLGIQPLKDIMNFSADQSSRRYSNDSMDSITMYRSVNRRNSSQASGSLLAYSKTSPTVEFEQNVFKFVFVENLPNVFSMDLYTLESVDFSFENILHGILPLLRIIIPVNSAYETQEQLTTLIMRGISEIFNFPLAVKFPNIIIQKLQLVVVTNSPKLINDESLHDYLDILQHNIALKYNDVIVVAPDEVPRYCYTVCINY
ncbi:similar to Kazachstania africana KAFR_0B05660 hypothetical protein [Maudiozyma saulgeensis]|uniref:Uncharacterized protein n=1 Tax=Maudiozyma saulgeensis TaxID=1789683 RepID=A0A1X7R635_9SACH|nr:similar to Kazachstania africana KAFR_0B05660 hypothetical protein [Kazachstania saulgeensis]